MSYLKGLLAVNSEQTVKFFLGHLGKGVAPVSTEAEVIYVASILAHYAHTSRGDTTSMPLSGSLYEVLESFVLPGFTAEGASGLQDPEILEIAGSQTLLLVGFFRDQMRRKHNLGFYDNLGRGFFGRASNRLHHGGKADLLRQVAQHFPGWAASCCKMSRTLREERYLLKM